MRSSITEMDPDTGRRRRGSGLSKKGEKVMHPERPHSEPSARPFVKTLRYARSLATWEAEGMCEALKRWLLGWDDAEGGTR